MLHAYRNPIRVFDLDGLTMLIGADDSSRMLEIGVAAGDGVEFIVHAMPARQRVPEVILMPRSIQEILDHADELAARFENYEPADWAMSVRSRSTCWNWAALGRARSERQVVDAVVAARSAGTSWQKIGDLLGTSAQAAQQRYGAVVEAV